MSSFIAYGLQGEGLMCLMRGRRTDLNVNVYSTDVELNTAQCHEASLQLYCSSTSQKYSF